MKFKFIIGLALLVVVFACNPSGNQQKPKASSESSSSQVDNGKGVGEITHVELNDPLDQEMVKRGKAIYEMKCAACHKLKGSRVVGPSWAGLTKTRKPEWIMNMITNVDVMLDEDPTAQKLLEECLTRMPNQNVSIGDARDLLEFMYQNDIDNAPAE